MAGTIRRVLAVGPPSEHFELLAPLLSRVHFDLDRVGSGESAGILLQAVAFDAVLISYPLPGFPAEDLVAGIRAESSPSRRAAIVLLAEPDSMSAARAIPADGLIHTVAQNATPDRLEEEVAGLLREAPRLTVRIPVRIEVQLGEGRTMTMCQTENVSAGGMLVRLRRPHALEARPRFELLLRDEDRAVTGEGVVVRHTETDRRGHTGEGIKFSRFDDDGGHRLRGYLERVLTQSAG